jgi:transcription elongation factor Elf1
VSDEPRAMRCPKCGHYQAVQTLFAKEPSEAFGVVEWVYVAFDGIVCCGMLLEAPPAPEREEWSP